MPLLAELKRRNVIRVAGFYLVAGWLVTQVAATLLPVFEAPGWVMKVLVGLLALGFLPALAFAWVFELTPQGLKRESEVDRSASTVDRTARKLDVAVIVMLLAVGALVLWQQQRVPAAPAATATEAPVTAATATAPATTPATAVAEKSIAVLPFVNMSPDKDNEYFSDGISEEILNALTKIGDLKVAGRTSSFHFKGKNESLVTIGETLGVAHVLEGSVRKQGGQVRITAQLIRTSDGFHLWSETYDGDLKDVFALQESIAQAIAGELKVLLQGTQKTRLVQAGTTNTDAYSHYLRASGIFNRRDSTHYGEARELLERAIALDPGYARAHSRLAALLTIYGNVDSALFLSGLPLIEQHANRAIALDPALAEPHAVLGLAYGQRRRFKDSDASMSRALALDPDDITTNFWNGTHLGSTGYHQASKAALDRALELDPLLPNALLWRGREHFNDGEIEQAETMMRLAAESGHGFVGLVQNRLDSARGDHAAALRSATVGLGYFSGDFPPGSAALFAAACLGDAAAKAKVLALVDAFLATDPDIIPGIVPYVLLRAGEHSRALALGQDAPTNNDALFLGELLSPLMADAQRHPAFPEFVRRSGLAALWDSRGPGDGCIKDERGDFYCGQ